MSGNPILDQYLGSRAERTQETDNGVYVAVESYVGMLDVQLGNGNRVALPYATLLKVTLDPSSGMTLHYPNEEITLRGRRLEALYKAIAQHRVTTVRESGSRHDLIDEGTGPAVTQIVCRSVDRG